MRRTILFVAAVGLVLMVASPAGARPMNGVTAKVACEGMPVVYAQPVRSGSVGWHFDVPRGGGAPAMLLSFHHVTDSPTPDDPWVMAMGDRAMWCHATGPVKQDESGAWVPDDSWGYSFDLTGYWMRMPGL